MQQLQPHQRPPRNTPRKSRPRRDSTQAPRSAKPAKNYASENDTPRDNSAIRTPRKGTPGANGHGTSNLSVRGNANNSHRRSKGRPSSIAITNSNIPARAGDRSSPPLTASKTSAYAGLTYHASPDPSSIPIPSFLKRGPESPSIRKPANIDQEPSPPASDSETSSLSVSPSPPRESQHKIQESPLEFIFKKDREEKSRRTNSAQGIASATASPFSPPEQSPPGLVTGHAYRLGPPTIENRSATTRISTEELSGSPGRSVGPAFATPFKDRIQAVRSGMQPHTPPMSTEKSPEEATRALKSLLSIGPQSSSGAFGNHTPYHARPPVFQHPSGNAPNVYQPIHGLTTGQGPPTDANALTNSLKSLLRIQ